MSVRLIRQSDESEWLRLRRALWPETSPEEHRKEMDECQRAGEEFAVFVSDRPGGGLQGFIELSIRSHAEGCTGKRIGYIEGWYVDPDVRQRGVGRSLVKAAEAWASSRGCDEVGSDAELENEVSLRAHKALGYSVMGRLIHFQKKLHP